MLSHTRGITSPTIRREMRRRNAIEPVLGHMKTDGLLERNHLHGPEGDAVNAILCAIGHNCRLLLAWFRRLLARLIERLLCAVLQWAPARVAPITGLPHTNRMAASTLGVLHGRRALQGLSVVFRN